MNFNRYVWQGSLYPITQVKCTLVQALRLCTGRTVHRGRRGLVVLFLDHGAGRGEVSASHPGRSLPLGKNRYPFYRRLGGPQGRSGGVENLAPTGIFFFVSTHLLFLQQTNTMVIWEVAQ